MAKGDKSSITVMHHLRWLAALLVGYSHIRQNLLLDYSDLRHPRMLDKVMFAFANYGHAGVIIFFVLSGFLVGGKAVNLFNSEVIATEWPLFFADRFSRIFVVLLPALALCAMVLLFLRVTAAHAPFMISAPWGWALNRPIDQDFSLLRWLNAVVLLNGLTANSLVIDSPLWSLAYEWFYYMMVLGVILVFRKVFSPAALVVITYTTVLFALTLVFNRAFLYLGLVWLLGVVAKIAFDKRILRSPILQWIGIALFVGLLVIDRIISLNDILLGSAVAFMIAHNKWAEWRGGERWGMKLASFSYSFYLVHFPITILVLGLLYHFDHIQGRLPLDTRGIAITVGTLAGAIIFSRIFAFFTEDRTRLVRNLLWQLATKKPVALPQTAVVEGIQKASPV